MWRIWIDTGGTFTDCVAVTPTSVVKRVKVLSSGVLRGEVVDAGAKRLRIREHWGAAPGFAVGLTARVGGVEARVVRHEVVGGLSMFELDRDPEIQFGSVVEVVSGMESPLLAAHLATGTPPGHRLPPIEMRLATTRGTNALLERRGARVGLFLTRGFGDLLRIGTQQRPDLFALDVRKPEPLYEQAAEVTGRIGPHGEIIEELDHASLEQAADVLVRAGVRIAAVALMHSWVNPEHERRLGEVLKARGFTHVSLSAALSPTIKYLARARTTVANAFLAPVIEEYLREVSGGLHSAKTPSGRPEDPAAPGSSLLVMTSAGGLVRARGYAPKDSLLSGPAAGVIGAASAAARSGFRRVITLDMGGTSTDVARFEGGCEYVFEHTVGDAVLASPAVAVESVAAGGGSECWVGVGGLEVGPRSAGSNPGPACYGAGGPLTVTDVNLLLGRLDAARFGIPVVEAAAKDKAADLRTELEAKTRERLNIETMLGALVEIADERMAEAVRRISVRRGFDPADHVLVAFGGAGGQHACGVAERLGVSTVLIPRDVGLLSAVGLGGARVERIAERQVLRMLDEGAMEGLEALEADAMRAVTAEGVATEHVEVVRRLVSLRLEGQESVVVVEAGVGAAAREVAIAFQERYRALYGYAPAGGKRVEVESMRVVAAEVRAAGTTLGDTSAVEASATLRKRMWFAGEWVEAPVRARAHMEPGERMSGPGLIVEKHATTVVAPGWTAHVDPAGAIVVTQNEPEGRASRPERWHAGKSKVRPEIIAGRLRAIAEEMGEVLRRTAISTNVKERLDYSCALLDSQGELVVNAPHIPVHLGALGVCVRAVASAMNIAEGDVVVTNHPGFGGSHLPDVTVVMPVHSDGRRIGWVANRAHHAEIGGIRPGSMPPGATCLGEEGVVIPPMYAVRGGSSRFESVEQLLLTWRFPTRNIGDNMADLRAQIASARRGAEAMAGAAHAFGVGGIEHAMEVLKDRAQQKTREAIGRFGDASMDRTTRAEPGASGLMMVTASRTAEERLDDGSRIRVKLDVHAGRAVIDFADSSGVHPGGFNAPAGIVRSAVMYVLRLLIDEDLPLNEGVMRAVELLVPEGMLNPPFGDDPWTSPCVAAGNVETSQRVVDALVKALGLQACGQGTMNNVIFGDDTFGYYETIGGGAGAGPGFAGAGGVHTHMTNTAITDPELLERRYPVRLNRFALRPGSGGAGKWRGGNGVVREFVFLKPTRLSLIGQHRVEAPFGMAGGKPGARGAQRIVRVDGTLEELPGVATASIGAGDRLIIETPGGGGYGAA